MSAPFLTHMAQSYRSPQNFNNQSKTYGKRPHPGFQWEPHTQFGRMNNSTTESNDEHWCETCDRGFPTADLLNQHKQQHQKCSIDGCQFVAHPKVVTRHIQMQHASGLYEKIAKLSNPEEIQKWREERKQKYPTRVNIEKKEAEYKEKVERGEKIGLKQNRSKVDKLKDQSAHRDRFNKVYKNHSTKKSNRNFTPKVPSMVEKNKLKPFTGILSICMNDDTEEDVCNLSNANNSLIEEDEYKEEQIEHSTAKPIQEQPVLCGALSSLMCDYGSSDENDVVEQQEPQKTDRSDRKRKSTSNTFMNNNIEIVKSNFKEATDVINSNINLDQTNRSEDDSDNDSGPDEVKNIKIDNKEPPCTPSTTSLKTPKTQCNKNRNDNSNTNLDQTNKSQDDSDNDSGPDEIKNIKIDNKEPPCTPSTTSLKTPKTQCNKNRNVHKKIIVHKRNVPSTLLHKLLRKEVKQERNIVLQCIRHIIKQNYYENK